MIRRNFLFASAAAVATRTLDAADRPHPMQYHLSCGAIGVKADQRQAIDYAAQYGFDCVDADGKYLGSLSDADLGRLLDDMHSKKVGWAIAGLPVEFRGDDAAFATGMTSLAAYARGLRRAHVDKVTTWILPMSKDLTYMQNLRVHSRRLREIASVLDGEGLRFGLEYVAPRTLLNAQRYTFVHTMAEMKDLIAEIARPNVGIVLDSWHWYTAGDNRADLLSLKASDVISVDLNDAPTGVAVEQQIDSKRELPAATGVIDVKTFLSSLKEIGYRGPVRAEPFNEAVRKMSAAEAIQATKAALDKAFAQIS